MTLLRVLNESGLNVTELAKLYGVSRQTIYTWLSGGHPQSNTYGARMQTVITAALINAIERGVLPLGSMDKGKRRDRIARMAVTCQNLRPAAGRV
jgi:DNA-binding XRE family transcriptional regulator